MRSCVPRSIFFGEKTPEEAVDRMSNGVREFLHKYGSSTKIEDLRFVVYNDPKIANMLRDGLASI